MAEHIHYNIHNINVVFLNGTLNIFFVSWELQGYFANALRIGSATSFSTKSFPDNFAKLSLSLIFKVFLVILAFTNQFCMDLRKLKKISREVIKHVY